jgi:2-C-methyl-D-erythritol 2,4-cyclodiphosphate synthase
MSANLRVGIGHDTHRLRPGGPLLLGGVTIEFDKELVGHSDADVLLHAVTDAILGAAAIGDIGELYPDTDEANRNRDSAEILADAAQRIREAGFEILNLDCNVFAERPKLSPYKLEIARNIGDILRIGPELVGVKAKTGEGVGDVGNGLVIQAQCVALLERIN